MTWFIVAYAAVGAVLGVVAARVLHDPGEDYEGFRAAFIAIAVAALWPLGIAACAWHLLGRAILWRRR